MLAVGRDARVSVRAHIEDHSRAVAKIVHIPLAFSRQLTPVSGTRRQYCRRDLSLRCEAIDTDVGPSPAAEVRPAQTDAEDEAPSTSVPTFSTWEIDFSSRPILDARGKKRWELLICSPDRSWVYSKWFPNNKINSTQVNPSTSTVHV